MVETETCAGENTRSKELMEKLGLENHILSSDFTPEINVQTDWKKIDDFFEEERNKSKEYFFKIAEKDI